MLTTLFLLAATAGTSLPAPATTPFAAPTAAPTTAPLDYDAAKALADRDEAAMQKVAADMLRRSQSTVLERAADACRTDEAITPFTVVLELDAQGKVTNHWRNAETKLAKCMDDKLSRQMFYVPSKAPFYISFEVTFTP
jgi:hypothetical protein